MRSISKIKGLTVVAFAALAGTLSGCIIDNSSNTGCADIRASWAIEDTNGAPLACADAPASTVRLFVNGAFTEFPCNAYVGISPGLDPGTYSASLQLIGTNGAVLSDTAVPNGPMTISLPSCGTFSLAAADPDVVFTVF
jgi:hypothetical protein